MKRIRKQKCQQNIVKNSFTEFLLLRTFYVTMTTFHSLHRSKVCFCGKKARRKVNDKEKNGFYASQGQVYDFEDQNLPDGICNNCIISLRSRTKRRLKIGKWKKVMKTGKICLTLDY
jgi:hypothetical protein